MISKILAALSALIIAIISGAGYGGIVLLMAIESARMPQLRFHLYTFLGSWPWCLGLAYLGMKAGEHWDYLRSYFHRFDAVIAAAIVIIAFLFIRSRWKNRLRESEIAPHA